MMNVAGSLDDSKWYHQVEPILDNGTNWANGDQHYTASENSFVSDGTLKIVAKKRLHQ